MFKKYIVMGANIAIFIGLSSVKAEVFSVTAIDEFEDALIEAQANGQDDTIYVASGTYEVDSTLLYVPSENKSLTIEGMGSDSTILEGDGNIQILSISTAYLSDDSNADIFIRKLMFQEGYSSEEGGGIYVVTYSASINVEDSRFRENLAGELGGGIYFYSSKGEATFRRNTFDQNSSNDMGGGAYVSSGEGAIMFTDNNFDGNSANRYGGGAEVYSYGGDITFSNNIFTENYADVLGGGIDAASHSGSITLQNNIVKGNRADSLGGGAYTDVSNSTITYSNNIFVDNSSDFSAGGAFVGSSGGTVTLTNNTFSANSAADGSGGGLYLHLFYLSEDKVVMDLYNNIIWGNTAFDSGEDIYAHDGSYTDVIEAILNLYNNDYTNFDNVGIDQVFEVDNIDRDPSFVSSSDFHLQENSPCVDIGHNDAPSLPQSDFEGESRINDGDSDGIPVVDLGADEFFVEQQESDSGTNNGDTGETEDENTQTPPSDSDLTPSSDSDDGGGCNIARIYHRGSAGSGSVFLLLLIGPLFLIRVSKQAIKGED